MKVLAWLNRRLARANLKMEERNERRARKNLAEAEQLLANTRRLRSRWHK